MNTGDITLTLEKRDVVGNKVRALRREGKTPAVIHNHGKESIIVDAPSLAMTKVYKEAGKHHPVNLTVGSEKYLAIIKDVDLDPRMNTVRHIVFGAIRTDEKVKAEVPVHLEGDEIPAEKAGYMVIKQLDHVEIEALPKNLPDVLNVSTAGLVEIGDKLTVADIQVPEGVTILTEQEHGVAVVEETKAQISEESEAAEGEEGEPEAGETPEEGKDTSTDE